MSGGTIVDATIVEAPSSTKNRDKKCDPEMHSTRKNAKWYYGMRVHIGTDPYYGFVHTIISTAANEAEGKEAPGLLREDDTVVYGDADYPGIQKRPEVISNERLTSIEYHFNCRPGGLPKVSDNAIDRERYIENRKPSVRRKAERTFQTIMRQFRYKKTVCRGLKNENRLYAMFACINLYSLTIAGRKLSTT